MAVAALKNPAKPENCYAVFGTSSGEIEFHRINLNKRRLVIDQQQTIRLDGSVLSMKRVKLAAKTIVVVGMSSGDIAVIAVEFDSHQQLKATMLGKIPRVHDFGVNSLDAIKLNQKDLHCPQIVVASGGDDQQLCINLVDVSDAAIAKWQLKRAAHTSCVKAVVIQAIGSQFLVSSSSYDQRLKQWVLDCSSGPSVSLKSISRHCLSDMNAVCRVSSSGCSKLVLLAGQGLVVYSN